MLLKGTDRICSVSYTHLDVYKRQVPYNVNATFTETDAADNVSVEAADVKPGVVTGLTCTKSNETKVSLSWNAADNATSYNVYKGSELIGTTTDCSYTYTGTFNVGDTASYTVKAVRGSAVGDGATIQVTTCLLYTSMGFNVSGGCYPEVHQEAESMIADIKNLKKKIDAGADLSLIHI